MLHQQIIQNKRKTILVLLVYTLLFLTVGIAIGYFMFDDILIGTIIATVLGGIYAIAMLSQSTEIVLKRNHVHQITEEMYPMLWHIVEDMAIVAQVPMPSVHVIQDDSPNAFATGMSPDKAAVAVTTGLLKRLNREELEGVIAHEFSHIKNYDVRLQTILVALGTAIALLIQFSSYGMRFGGRHKSNNNDKNSVLGIVLFIVSILAIFLAPLLSTLTQLALSRNREYLADATAVSFTRNPQGLISALQIISQSPDMKGVDPQSAALYIASPIHKKEKDSLFATHPSTANRIARLRNM
ncbi:zinc metalloprotease HtpX [Carnobacteriaceae bacterium zg-ZUI78]|nr:zinc metalloprotease HtpX [Carnobacteriaceae bacterium zg-ZUI78]